MGSVTKSFVGTVALQLVDEGRLRLDDRLAQFLPDFPNGAQITVRQLLDMTSGLYDYSLDPAVNEALAADPQRISRNHVGRSPLLLRGNGAWQPQRACQGDYSCGVRIDLNRRDLSSLGIQVTVPIISVPDH